MKYNQSDMRKLILSLLLLAGLTACRQKPFIDVQAHRGGAGLMPENTVSAMRNALDLAATAEANR